MSQLKDGKEDGMKEKGSARANQEIERLKQRHVHHVKPPPNVQIQSKVDEDCVSAMSISSVIGPYKNYCVKKRNSTILSDVVK